MKTVRADLSIDIFVDCPHCDCFINLMDKDDTNGRDHNEESKIIKQACPDGVWSDEHEKFSVKGVVCSECEKEFDVKGLGW